MSGEVNKGIVCRFYELLSRGALEASFRLLAPEFICHYTTGDVTLEETKKIATSLITAFPDVHFTFSEWVVEGDRVAVQTSWSGTHKGEYMGIPSTGNKVNVTNTGIFRIENGKMAEIWMTADILRLMQQLGVGVIPKK